MKLSYLIRDCQNRIKYGKNAPLTRQLIWINPQQVNNQLVKADEASGKFVTATVLDGDWDLQVKPFPFNSHITKHFLDGVPWHEINIDPWHRHNPAIWEAIYADMAGGKLMKTYHDRHPLASRLLLHREYKGVCIHIDRNGNPIMGNQGNHRMTIAKILKVEWLPAQVRYVNLQAIKNGAWHKVRSVKPISTK